jgi:ankyrin repeat protein
MITPEIQLNQSLKFLIDDLEAVIKDGAVSEKVSSLEKSAIVFFENLTNVSNHKTNEIKNMITQMPSFAFIEIFKIHAALLRGGVLADSRKLSAKGISLFENIFQSAVETSHSQEVVKKINDTIFNILNDPQLVQIFLDNKGDINLKDEKGNSLLHYAIYLPNYDLASKLLLLGAECDPFNEIGRTPLMIAALLGHTNIVKLLIKHGADPFLVDQDGNSVLFLAVGSGDLETVTELLLLTGDPRSSKKGAECDLSNKNGRTPLMLAAHLGYTNIIKLLINYGADPLLLDQNGDSVLVSAVHSGNLEAVTELLPFYTKFMPQPGKNGSPWVSAKIKGNQEIAKAIKNANMKTSLDRKWKNVKRLGHQFSWIGKVEITEGKHISTFDYEGSKQEIWLSKMGEIIEKYEKLPLNERSTIAETFARASANKTRIANEYLKSFSAGKPVIIPSGWEGDPGHAISIILVPSSKKEDPSYLYLCDSGGATKFPVEVFTFEANKLTEEHFQSFFLKQAESQVEFLKKKNIFISLLNIKQTDISKLIENKLKHLPFQTTGNCSWICAEMSFLVLSLALKLKDVNLPIDNLDTIFEEALILYEIFGQRLRIEGVQKYVNDLVDNKFEEFDSQITINSFVELWKLKIEDEELLKRLNELESLYLNYTSPLMQGFFKIIKLESTTGLNFPSEELFEIPTLKEDLTPTEITVYGNQFIRAIMAGNITLAKALLIAGFDPNTLCNGKNPLIEATKIRNVELVQLLLEYKSNPNVLIDKKTSLYWALSINNLELVELLVKKGADVDEDIQVKGSTMSTMSKYFKIAERYKTL